MITVQTQQRLRGAVWILLAGYSLFMTYLLFFGFSRSDRSGRMYNLIPFKTIANYIVEYHHFNFFIWAVNLFGNVGAFIPFGILVPWLYPVFTRSLRLASLFVLILLAVEAVQFAGKVGSFDIDDILLNVLGILLGRACFSGLKRLGIVKGGKR